MHFATNFCRAKYAVLASVIFLAALPEGATAYTLKTLYSFGMKANQADGAYPLGGLIADPAGNLYGTTSEGGKSGAGIVFELVRPTGNSKWKYKVIHDFCSLENCADGAFPRASLILDSSGNLYGTTANDGVFELKPNPDHTYWTVNPIYTFCTDPPYCTDGDIPNWGGLTYRGAAAGAAYDGASPLYGMTGSGGNGVGVVFSLTPTMKGRWTEKVLHAFCNADGCDGYSPVAGLAFDANGNMFGMTEYSTGMYGGGVVFELTERKHGKWDYQVLHLFGQNGAEEAGVPTDTPITDSQGNVFGTTSQGGNGGGAFFKLVPNGSDSQVTQPYAFCTTEACSDGQLPYSGVVMDGAGTLFGTTWYGGKQKVGVIYRYDGQFSVLYDFCRKRACRDGSYPSYGNLFLDTSGNIFGMTYNGGKGGVGTIFELSP